MAGGLIQGGIFSGQHWPDYYSNAYLAGQTLQLKQPVTCYESNTMTAQTIENIKTKCMQHAGDIKLAKQLFAWLKESNFVSWEKKLECFKELGTVKDAAEMYAWLTEDK